MKVYECCTAGLIVMPIYGFVISSIVFWFGVCICWFLEYNQLVPHGTAAAIADYYPLVSSDNIFTLKNN